MNLEKIKQLQEFIKKQPDVIMANILVSQKDVSEDEYHWLESCGTVGCVAGNACLMEDSDTKGVYALDQAIGILDLTYSESRMLFHLSNWPPKFQRSYLGLDAGIDLVEFYNNYNMEEDEVSHNNGVTAEQRKQIMIDRLDHFMETGR